VSAAGGAPAGPAWAGHEVVDLSLTLAEDLPCHWSTHQPFQHKIWTWFTTRRGAAGSVYNRSGAPYTTRWMAIDEHTGTHFDAPSHFVPPPDSGLPGAHPTGEISADRVPVTQLMGPAAVIDVTGLGGAVQPVGTSPEIDPAVVTDWERRHGRLAPGDVVLFHTGWDRHYLRGADGDAYLFDVVVTRTRPGWPAPAVATVELLLERGVRCLGIDAPSMGLAHDGAAAHVSGLRGGAVFVECLTGLDRLPPRGAWFCVLPLKVEQGTGAPGRAVAFRPPADAQH
jgi:kynurenine formamidase